MIRRRFEIVKNFCLYHVNRRPYVTWLVYVLACTTALLVPIRVNHELYAGHLWLQFTFYSAKTLHVLIYLSLAYVSGWLRVPMRSRLWLLFFIMAHGALTEFIQDSIPSRYGSPRDVCLDHVGVALGLYLSWKWWTQPDAPLERKGEVRSRPPIILRDERSHVGR